MLKGFLSVMVRGGLGFRSVLDRGHFFETQEGGVFACSHLGMGDGPSKFGGFKP